MDQTEIHPRDMQPKPHVDLQLPIRAPVEPLNHVQAGVRRAFLAKLASGEYRLERVDTCLCGCTSGEQVADHDRFGVPVGVEVCADCGLARTSPRLAADCLPAFYEHEYHGLHMGLVIPDASTALYRQGQGSQIFARVADLLPRSVRVAEIGCGTGQVLREFEVAAFAAGHRVQAVGCEYASAYVEAGRTAGSDIRSGGPSVLVADGPFDLVILSHVVEHFADVPGDLESVSRLLDRGGLAYVEVPGILAIHRKPQYDFRFSRYLTLAHTYHFSLATLTDAMGRTGFELVRGNEDACTVFRWAAAPVVRRVPERAGEVVRYLAWLESSPSVRAQRIALWTRRRTRSTARTVLQALLGPRTYRALREKARSRRIVA